MVLCFKYACRPYLMFLRSAHLDSFSEYNHYKTLGLSSSATNAEIKAAYYELSKKYHPDRNHGSKESAKLFTLVKAAYDVLGNERRRMQYDKQRIFKDIKKSVNIHSTDNNPDYKDEAERIHFQSRVRRPFRKYSYGKTSYYDFDAWFEGHYGKENRHVFQFREPRKFKHYYHYEVSEKDYQFYDKVKSRFLFVFMTLLVLSSLTVCDNKKTKRKLIFRAAQIRARDICVSNVLRKNLYEALGLSRNATQAEIKKAYFELSKIYHPDRIAATDENLAKFREISAAYEILGNEHTRKLYDRGLLMDDKKVKSDDVEDISDPIIKFYKQRQELSKTLSKGIEESDVWAQTYFKKDKAKSSKIHQLYRHTKATSQREKTELEALEEHFYVYYILAFVFYLFTLNLDTKSSQKIIKFIEL